jgi:osmotically-inducible protein OsmY
MKRILTAAIAAAALTAAVPALAQSYLGDRATQMDQRIDTGVSDGSLTHGQADTLRDRLDSIERTQDRYQAEGMAGWQSRALNRSYDNLGAQIYNMRHDSDGYLYRHRDDDIW